MTSRDGPAMVREIRADNPSAMTLDGTRTFIVGRRRVAVIDPGPADSSHSAAIVEAVIGDDHAPRPVPTILLTHLHGDHAAGAEMLAAQLGASVRAVGQGTLNEGDEIPTDAGALITLLTPGHTPDHASFHHVEQATVFCGDLMMGGLDTALVSPPEGDLRLYLDSLERIRSLRPKRILPAHGPPIDDPENAISRYVQHRRQRCEQVVATLTRSPLAESDIAARVYGAEVPVELRAVAVGAVVAYLQYLEQDGRVARTGALWRSVA